MTSAAEVSSQAVSPVLILEAGAGAAAEPLQGRAAAGSGHG